MANIGIFSMVATVMMVLGCIFSVITLSTSYWGEMEDTQTGAYICTMQFYYFQTYNPWDSRFLDKKLTKARFCLNTARFCLNFTELGRIWQDSKNWGPLEFPKWNKIKIESPSELIINSMLVTIMHTDAYYKHLNEYVFRFVDVYDRCKRSLGILLHL